MSLETMSFSTKSLATIVPRDKFYNRLKQKTRIIIQIRDLHCLLSLVTLFFKSDHLYQDADLSYKDFNRAQEADPNSADVLMNRGWSKIQ